MKLLTRTRLLLALLLFPLATCAASNRHVVVITIDGLAAFYLQDPGTPLPTLRRLAAEGAVAEALHVSNPTTTWPNHTTLVTGVSPAKHSVLFNGKLIRGAPGQPVKIEGDRNQNQLVAVPTIYDQVHRAGGRTAAINWPCTRGSETLDDNWPDAPDGLRMATPRLRAELVQGRILEDANEPKPKSAAAADQAWTAAALHLLRERPPELLLLHLLTTDVIQHRYGPKSPAADTSLALADALVADVVRAIESAGLREQTILLVLSDHGFARPLKLISPNVVLRKAGLQRPGRRRVQSISEGGTAFVYLTEPETATADRAQAVDLLRSLEGVQSIVQPAEFRALGLPEPASNPQAGDLLLVAKDGYAFSDESLEDDVITPLPVAFGSHGYLASDSRMDGIFIVWGRGIQTGAQLSAVDIIDVAPTVAALLGVALPQAEGKALREILSRDSVPAP